MDRASSRNRQPVQGEKARGSSGHHQYAASIGNRYQSRERYLQALDTSMIYIYMQNDIEKRIE